MSGHKVVKCCSSTRDERRLPAVRVNVQAAEST